MNRLPVARLFLLAALILVGLGLFIALSHRTPIVINPPAEEAKP